MFAPIVIAGQIPSEAIKKGSLANQKLMRDTMAGLAVNVSRRGCKKPENFVPYVRQFLEGEVGSRYWQEIWIVSGCSQEYPVTIKFSEDGLNAANWEIQQ